MHDVLRDLRAGKISKDEIMGYVATGNAINKMLLTRVREMSNEIKLKELEHKIKTTK